MTAFEEEYMALKIMPHGRLQEWVAEEKGFFTAEGLDYTFLTEQRGLRHALRPAGRVAARSGPVRSRRSGPGATAPT